MSDDKESFDDFIERDIEPLVAEIKQRLLKRDPDAINYLFMVTELKSKKGGCCYIDYNITDNGPMQAFGHVLDRDGWNDGLTRTISPAHRNLQ